MLTKLLINPRNLQIAATLEEGGQGKKITILDERVRRILTICGINVPRSFTPDRSYHMYLDNPDQNLFAEAFEQHFYPHGLMQKGFYWMNEEDYHKELSNFATSENIALAIIERHLFSS